MPLLASTISSARHSSLVGWRELRVSLLGLLGAPPPHVIYLHGVGGIGKSSFLAWIEHSCVDQGLTVKPLNTSFISEEFELPEGCDMFTLDIDQPRASNPRIDKRIRHQLVPNLSTDSQLVIATRDPPSADWLAEPGLCSITRFVELGPWSTAESAEFLTREDADGPSLQQILEFARGHPFALSLANAATKNQTPLNDAAFAKIAKTLADQFIDGTPTTAQRDSLDVVGLVSEITEDLLCATVGDQGAPLFSWLQTQSFMRCAVTGLAPDPLAQEAFSRSLRWRNPERFQLLHDKVRAHLLQRLASAGGAEAERLILDLVHLHQDNPLIHAYIPAPSDEVLVTGCLASSHHNAVLSMVEDHEGRAARSYAARLLEDHADDVVVVRNQRQEVVGCAFVIGLPWSPDTTMADPALSLAAEYLAPFRKGQLGTAALYVRFWMAADGYQDVNPVQEALLGAVARRMLAEKRVRFFFIATAEPERWEPAFAYIEFERIAEVDFDCGQNRFGVFGHDWETGTRKSWLDHLRIRETSTSEYWEIPSGSAEHTDRAEEEIRVAVIDALKGFGKPAKLRNNPLLYSGWVNQRVPPEADLTDRVGALESLISEAVGSLQGSARDLKLHRAIYHTHLQPASTQERVAELLDLPFSTYRRHLTTGRELVAQYVCALELNSGPN